jgi:hypothetical protein
MRHILHPSRRVASLLVLGMGLYLLTLAADAVTFIQPAPRTAMTWEAPKEVDKPRARLDVNVFGHDWKDAATHLELQYRIPFRAWGTEKSVQFGIAADTTITDFSDWPRQYGIRLVFGV